MQAWTAVYTWATWQEFLSAGGSITGFPERRWSTVQRIVPGDLILAYLLGISRYVGVLEVAGAPFKGYKPIWSSRLYPCRVPVQVRLALLPEYGVPVSALGGDLSYFQDPRTWAVHFRTAPIEETAPDAEVILSALEAAAEEPLFRAYDPDRLALDALVYETAAGVSPCQTRP
ncbi:MAG: hypothetical protein HC915_17520, partial [Anaerolineae bacterium]|nr:hypothetical protein [Anaerolineae bacterium]